jgi:hypothetical protein
VLNQPRIFNPTVSGGLFTNGVWQSATLNAPNINGGQITGATIDCTTQACTQAPGTCDGTIATTGYVCQAVNDAISGANPNFCAAVDVCLAGGPSTCTLVINCINTNIGSIFNPAAFDPSVYADTVQYGVTRYATIAEVQGASALLAIDPATLGAFWSAGGPNALWTAFEAGVCAAGASCFAPITSPVFLGDPQAPTPLPGDNDTSIATTAFVQAAITAGGFAPINNPVFTGDPQAPTPLAGDNDTSIATTAYVQNEINLLLAPTPAFCAAVGLCGYALLASPTFTGDPQSTTPAPGDNDNSIATTAFVQGEIATAMATITGGPISFSSTPVGNAAATETDAFLHNLTAGLLAANGDAWEFEAAGTFAATVSVDKRIRVYFGATIVFDSGNLAITSAETWRLTGTVVRTAAAAEKVAISLITSDGTIQAIGAYSTAAENTAVAQPVKLTINGTNANDVIAEFFRDRYVPA